MKKTLTITAFLLSLAMPTGANTDPGINIGAPEGLNPLHPNVVLKGLLDPSRFEINQSVSLGFGTGGSGFSQVYLNNMTYQATEKLTINATLGLHNRAFGRGFYGSTTNGASFVVPNVSLIYKPRQNMTLMVGFSNIPRHPYYGYGYGPSWNRW